MTLEGEATGTQEITAEKEGGVVPMYKRALYVLRALQPISHGDTLSGVDNQTNTRLFMRSLAVVDGVPVRVPDVSENALRSVIFRRTLHDHLVGALGIGKGELPQAVVNLLYSGGNLASGAKQSGNVLELGSRVRELYPTLELLGGATDSFVLSKSALRIAAWPVGREYARPISLVAPGEAVAQEAESFSVFELLSEEIRVRGTGAESSGNQMLYAYETLAAGTQVLVEVTLDALASPAAEAAAALALARWDGYFGGQGRQGRGRIVVETIGEPTPTDAYLAHIENHRDEMREGLVSGMLGTERALCVLQ